MLLVPSISVKDTHPIAGIYRKNGSEEATTAAGGGPELLSYAQNWRQSMAGWLADADGRRRRDHRSVPGLDSFT
jgi:hypothetical protein